MKSKVLLLIVVVITGFLAFFACLNPIIEELYYVGEEKPVPGTPITGNPDIEPLPTVTYTVSFDTNGGSLVDCQPVTKGEKAVRPPNPTRGGYGFVNWYDNEKLSDSPYDFETSVLTDITLYADWSETFYKIIFMDGETEIDNQLVGENGTVSSPDPTREGYTFDGWYIDPELTDVYDFDTSVIIGIVLYAKWTLNTYTVTFMDGDRVLSGLIRNAIPHGTAVNRPETDPSKDGYIFGDWYSNSGLTTLFSFSTPITDNTIVYAKFNIKTYTVTFMDGDTVLAELTRSSVPHGSIVNRPATDPTKDGYFFVNWYDNEELSEPPYDFDTLVICDFTLYVKWTLNAYTVTFMDGDKVLSGFTRNNIPHGSTMGRPATDPTKDGYTFDDWYSDPELTDVYDFDTPVTDNTTVYAKFNIKTYTVTFMDGGTVLSGFTRDNIPHGSTVGRPATDPAKDGHTFYDWYSNSGLTTLFSFSTPITNNTTVYAKFNIRTYTVTFMDGDAVLSALTQIVVHGSTISRPSDPTKDGYFIFDDWYTDSVLVTSFNFSTPIIGNKTVYSRWLDSDFPGEVIDRIFGVSNIAEWNDARNTISTGGNNKNYIINIIADFTIAGSTEFASTTVTFSGSGIKVSLRGAGRTLNFTGYGNMLRTNAGQTLILRDLTLQGHQSNSVSLVHVAGSYSGTGAFIMESGKICGNNSGRDGGGVSVDEGGIFTMNGGEISGNLATYGGGVDIYWGGTFTMNGGEISFNSARSDGGGVYVEEGTFEMYGGKITGGNIASYSGGGVYVYSYWGSTFTMYGGEISGNNSAGYAIYNGGGGVYIDQGVEGTFRIVTGTIYGLNAIVGLGNYANLENPNSGSALLKNGGTAQYGKFNGTTWVKSGDLQTTNNTIKVVDGTIINE
jgi:uncharacterized repeat protein (TIGR02543 family)